MFFSVLWAANMDGLNTELFFALIRAGLWEDTMAHDSRFTVPDFEQVDWNEVCRLAEEQSSVGVVLAGIDWFKVHDTQFTVTQEVLFQWIGEVQMLEQQNIAMNQFIGRLVGKMRDADIYTLLVKGQGIAQCYERPLWRCCGDVDLFLNNVNYNKTKRLLVPIASEVEREYIREQHLGMTIDNWVVELHGALRCGLSRRIDKTLDEIQNNIFCGGSVRSWMNGSTQVFLPGENEDAVFVFTHILRHLYEGGIGIRQICDWCRLLWTYRDSLNYGLLELRIRKMGLMSEWRAFGAFAVDYLGMPSEAMPMYSSDKKWKRKAKKLCAFILKVGNFGHNRDMSYFEKYPYLIRKVCSMGRRFGDVIRHVRIFPLDSLRFFPYIMYNGIRSAVRGE